MVPLTLRYPSHSKNAAFFLGDAVKAISRQNGSSLVHELRLEAGELARRWESDAASTYTATRVARSPGDVRTLTRDESHPICSTWVQEETSAHGSFTRFVISRLSDATFRALSAPGGMQELASKLSHVYFFYLHGPDPVTSIAWSHAAANPPEWAPSISLQSFVGGRLDTEINLGNVTDNLAARMCTTSASIFEFAYRLPQTFFESRDCSENDGVVHGFVSYFPCSGDRETVPVDDASAQRITFARRNARRAAAGHPAGSSDEDVEEDEEDGGAIPMFETFWQGRLIPDTTLPALPFIAAAFAKGRSAKDKDVLPDAVRDRIRGFLFFGTSAGLRKHETRVLSSYL